MLPLSCARARPRSCCCTPAHESQYPAHFFGLVYSQFELIKIKMVKLNYNFFIF
jgi:hypothetical protein